MTFRDRWGYFIDTVTFCRCEHDCVHAFACPDILAYLCAYGRQRSPLVLSTWLTDLSEWSWSSLFQPAPRNCLPLTFRVGIIDMCDCDCVTVISFYLSAGDMNSGPHACITTTLPTEPPPNPLIIHIWQGSSNPVSNPQSSLLLPLKCWHYKHASQRPIKK